MKAAAVIPARMGSSRFPGKPLVELNGLPMIEHVRRRVLLCDGLDRVVVATCDREIQEVVEGVGGEAMMTSDAHERGTDRVAEAAQRLDVDTVLNVQGDEPLVRPEMLEALIAPLEEDPELPATNLVTPVADLEEFLSLDVPKVVADQSGDMMFISREPIPCRQKDDAGDHPRWKQLGIYGFRSEFLATFSDLPPTPLEMIESIDMLRILEHGYRLRMVDVDGPMIGVDRPEDVRRAEAALEQDPLVSQYL